MTCPAHRDGVCRLHYPTPSGLSCLTWRCPACRRDVPYCGGTAATELCDECACARAEEHGGKIARLRARQRSRRFRLAVLTREKVQVIAS